MPLRKLFKRQEPAAGPLPQAAGEDDALVHAARTQARQRLIGAVVLLAIGVIVFPLLFDSKPRPLPGEVRIELQRSVGIVAQAPPASAVSKPAALPPSVSEAPVEDATASASTGSTSQPPAAVETPGTREAQPAREAPETQPVAREAAPAAKAAKVARAAEAPKPSKASDVPKAPTVPVASTAADAPPASAASGARFVVQVGAFTDPVAIRETRQRVEKLGLKTYTQVIENDAGKRTRVRVGPFETRAEAEAAGVKIKAAGLPAYLLSL